VAVLIERLQEVGADHHISALADRLAAAGMFYLCQEYDEPRFRFGREPDGSPAEPWGWDDLA
jgi:hypothetical protein